MFLAGGNAYTLAHEHKNGWNAEAFKERYSEVLERYDYIVGDWGYNQLRLRGFYKEGNPKGNKDTVISSLTDYLNEYCNFGCAYFVLAKTDAASVPAGTPDLTRKPDVLPENAETDAQTAETAAASASHNGILMRWPLKERPGGPVRMPGAAAVARAAAEAERRNQQAQAGGGSGDGRSFGSGRQGNDGGYGGRNSARPSYNHPDKRPYGSSVAGQADGRPGGKGGQAGRGPRPPMQEKPGGGSRSGGSWRHGPDGDRGAPEPAASRAPEGAGQRQDAGKSGGRWPGKNRRRNRFGGKPNRHEGAPRESGTPVKPGE
ncbi:YutD family protein [Cohnella caldifontis]|uniref:YutD family protein n=1 Tax=Cohnella caldifontis TaxID=3027471 RepID=UPI0030D8035C